MLVNPKFITYSPFFINIINDDDMASHYSEINYYLEDTLLPNKVGMFVSLGEINTSLHPIYHSTDRYSDINAKNIKSYLNRNRYLSNKKHNNNDNYRSLFHGRTLSSKDFDDMDDWMMATAKNKEISITSYGSADNPNQIYNRLNFLNKLNDREFVIGVSFIHKEILKDGESSYGGYRQHKNGGYFGSKLLQHEYLADEDEIEKGIFRFNIVELQKSTREVTKKEHFIFCKSRSSSNQHYIFDARNDSHLIAYVYVHDDMVHVGDVMNKLISYPFVDKLDFDQIDRDLFTMLSEFESKDNI